MKSSPAAGRWYGVRWSLWEFNRVKEAGKSLMFSSKAHHQDPLTPLSGQSLLQPIDLCYCCVTSLLYHTIHSVLIIIMPKRRPPSACRISCKFQPFLTPFINTTCSDIDCYVLSVLTSHLTGHTVWNQLSSLLLGGLHGLLQKTDSCDRWSWSWLWQSTD